MSNLLNPSFDGGMWRKTGETGVAYPDNWNYVWLDNVWNPRDIGRRGQKVLKPEFEIIEPVAPYLKPPRAWNNTGKSIKAFKAMSTLQFYIYQTINVPPGANVKFTAKAHAWSKIATDPDRSPFDSTDAPGDKFWLEGTAGLTDAQRNFRFRVGIDMLGADNPLATNIVWGQGAHIYNVFHDIPLVEVTAPENKVTLIIAVDSIWGFLNSDAYIDSCTLEVVGEGSSRGKPRIQYERVYWVLPQDTPPARANEIMAKAATLKGTVGFSYDDAGIGDLDKKTAVLWDLPVSRQQEFLDWYAQWYPGTIVEFRDPKVM